MLKNHQNCKNNLPITWSFWVPYPVTLILAHMIRPGLVALLHWPIPMTFELPLALPVMATTLLVDGILVLVLLQVLLPLGR